MKNNDSLSLNIDLEKLSDTLNKFENTKFEASINANFSFLDGNIQINDGEQGFGLNDKIISQDLLKYFSNNLEKITARVKATPIRQSITKADIKVLSGEITSLVTSKISVDIGKSTTVFSDNVIADWLSIEESENGATLIRINPNEIKSSVQKIAKKNNTKPIIEVTTNYISGKKPQVTQNGKNGLKVSNINQLSDGIFLALSERQDFNGKFSFKVIDFPKSSVTVDDTIVRATYTYSVAVWGNVLSSISDFKALAQETLSSIKGWSGAGITFQRVASGGDFTLVLAEPSRVAAASPGCSSYWSCRVGRYIIINDDRWRTASSAWNSGGGGLRDYQHMVVNHEVGHWLGFGHRYCSGTNNLAPIMQQQSISLQGCKFNPWPTTSELNSI
jgi:hypothetical protein